MNMKKTLAGVMAVAMTATMLPGSMFAVPETAEAAADIETVSLPEAKYEMALDGNLDVTGLGGVSVVTLGQGYASYDNGPAFVNGRSGQALNTRGEYGIRLENVAVDSTYTISAWVNLQSAVDNSPVISSSNPTMNDNWLTLAGGGSTEYKLWTDSNLAEGGGQSELGRISYKNDQWVNYVLSVDGESASLYENGERVITGSNSGVVITSANKNITFGVNPWADAVPTALFDDIKIYEEALTASQAQALYVGTALTLTASSEVVRPGKTTELTADVVSTQDDVTVEWSTESECATVDNEGVVTGVSEGTAVITATAVSGEEVLASDTIEIKVVPQGELIADFTFDSWEEGFEGAGAVAKQIYPDAGNLTLVPVENRGQVLNLQPAGAGVANNDGLSVTKTDNTGLLNGVKEFTVSYDSMSRGAWYNAWVFYADEKGATDTSSYLSVREENANEIKPGRVLSGSPSEELIVPYTADPDGWKHVDVVFSEDRTDVYVNGLLVDSMANAISLEMCMGLDTDVRIGDSNYAGESWDGMLDNFKIYNYALTAEEIAAEAVDSVKITSANEESTMYVGNTLQLAATATPEEASYTFVEWNSSEPEIASVDEDGVVTANATGNVTITATVRDKEGMKTGRIDLEVRALTHHEAKEPTCTEDGNYEYWEDEKTGTLYSNSAGSEITTSEKVIRPATGVHDYSIVWNWVKIDDYTASVTFTCNVCGESESVDAEVSSTTVEGITTYTATAVFNDEEYTATKEIVNNYTLTVEGGTITDGQKDSYSYADKVTVTADESRGGKYFSGWYVGDTLVSQKQTYTFFVLDNMTVTAEYEGEDVVEEQPVVTFDISERQGVSGTDYNKVALTAQWSLPADYEFVGAGIIRSYSEYNDEEFRLDDVDGSDIRVQKTTLTNKNGTYKYNLTMSATTKLKTVYARGYVTYKDSEGKEYTVYTDIAQSAYTGI